MDRLLGCPLPAALWHSELRLRTTPGILSSCGRSKSESVEPYVKLQNLRTALALCALSLFGALWLPVPAAAHLGGDAVSVDTDRQVFQAQLRSIPMQQYTRHEISSASGSWVHEYETRQGTVFAVTWQGALPPDLHQLFGDYYQRYQAAAAAHARPGMHRQLNVEGPDLVVQSTGRLRNFRGKAYLPSLVPAGVSVADLQ
jgi:Protein of unknown function (DUF2844)